MLALCLLCSLKKVETRCLLVWVMLIIILIRGAIFSHFSRHYRKPKKSISTVCVAAYWQHPRMNRYVGFTVETV